MAELALALKPLPVGSVGRLSSGWWGMLALIATESSLFAYLLFSYFYVASQAVPPWPPGGVPALGIALPNTVLLLASSACVAWAERGVRRNRRRLAAAGASAALVLGIAFVALQALEWSHQRARPASGVYGSLYFTITGFHIAHVIVGLLVLLALVGWTALGYFGAARHSVFSIGALYWHFVDVVWLAVFATLYLSPRLM